MPETHFDTLIVGQGLAGSLLAWQLIHAGQQVCVIDDAHTSSSSAVAAGLINPLAGMRFNRRPEMDSWLQAADYHYAQLAARFGTRFFHPLPMLRLFRSQGQKRFHARRLADRESRGLLGQAFSAADCPEPINAPEGGFTQQRTGFVDMPLLLEALRNWLQDKGCLHLQTLNYDQIDLSYGRIRANGLTARRLIFCDGARLRFNPWFSHLPLTPDKGEILDLRVNGLQLKHIVNGAHWLVPMANGELRLGATHEHHQLDNAPTPAGARELLAGLDTLLPSRAETNLVRHQAGIRPATRDRYPLIGQHANLPQLWVCNGFGARGALTIPWYAACLSAHILQDAPLPPEADIRRFT